MARPGNVVKHRGYSIHKVRGGCRVYAPGSRKPILFGRVSTLSDIDKCKRAVDADIREIAERREGRDRWYKASEMRAHVMDRMKHKHLLR